MNWVAATVITGKEYDVKKCLQETLKDVEVYIPRRLVTEYHKGKIRQRTENMLPGYVLIGSIGHLSLGSAAENHSITVIGPITEEEYDSLKAQEYNETLAGTVEEGTKIIINDGPFMGCKGTILGKSKSEKNIKCRLVFHGMEIPIEIEERLVNTI